MDYAAFLADATAKNKVVHTILAKYAETGNVSDLGQCTFLHIVVPSERTQIAMMDFGLSAEDVNGKTGVQIAKEWLEKNKNKVSE